MKNKRDYIDRLDLWNNLPMHYPSVDDAILSAPTVDAVPVVRCKDCKYARNPFPGTELGDTIECARRKDFYESDNFCKYAEIKDGDLDEE